MSYFSSPYFASPYYFNVITGVDVVPVDPVYASLRTAVETSALQPVSYVYPSRDIDRPAELVAELGDFWSTVYADDFPARWASQRGRLEAQTVQNLLEARDSLSRVAVPLHHTDVWRQLVLQESQLS
jgi:hypothetical protein